MKPHKHAKFIKAWADGAEIEYFDEEWSPASSPSWCLKTQYRIKPEEKINNFKYYNIGPFGRIFQTNDSKYYDFKITFDGETGELKSAEVIK
jgi:hypothetical protein